MLIPPKPPRDPELEPTLELMARNPEDTDEEGAPGMLGPSAVPAHAWAAPLAAAPQSSSAKLLGEGEGEGEGKGARPACPVDASTDPATHHGGMNVLATTLLLVADVVGTGVLALGGDMATLGWLPGMIGLAVFAPFNYFAGCLLSDVSLRQKRRTRDYFDIATLLFSEDGHGNGVTSYMPMLVGITLYSNLFLVMGDYLLVMTKSMQSIFYNTRVCATTAGLVSALPLLGVVQCRTMKGLSMVAFLSISCIAIAVVISLVRLLLSDPEPTELTNGRSDFLSICGALNALVFASGGQKIYPNIAAEMKDPAQFPRALAYALTIFMSIYFIVAAIAYSARGESTPGYLLDVLPFTVWKVVAGVCMWIHVAISFALQSQVLCRAITCTLFQKAPSSTDRDSREGAPNGSSNGTHNGTSNGTSNGTGSAEHPPRSSNGHQAGERVGAMTAAVWSPIPHSSEDDTLRPVDHDTPTHAPRPAKAKRQEGLLGAPAVGCVRDEAREHAVRVQYRVAWFLASSTLLLFAWVLANSIPFFEDLVSLIGSLTTTPLAFIWPSLFADYIHRRHGAPMTRVKRAAVVGLGVFGFLLAGIGTAGSIRNVLLDWRDYGRPFDCHCEARQCVEDD